MEHFTQEQIIDAIDQFLKLGEDSEGSAHQGHFSGFGWAATVLRFHLDNLMEEIDNE